MDILVLPITRIGMMIFGGVLVVAAGSSIDVNQRILPLVWVFMIVGCILVRLESDWFFTSGQIVHSGNLVYSAASCIRTVLLI